MTPSKNMGVRNLAKLPVWPAVLACTTVSVGLLVSGSGCGDERRVRAPGASGADGAAGAPGMPICGLDDPTAIAACADEARYVGDLSFVAGDRTPGSAHWQEVQSFCAGRLTELGYEVEQQAYGVWNPKDLRRGSPVAGEPRFFR